ncbi:MAG: thermonuclease family protein [Myxococcota bacterium]
MKLALALAFCFATPSTVLPAHVSGITIHWVDGDSGTIGDHRFRLADVDAPEIGAVGSSRGAKCESERLLGQKAHRLMRHLSKNATVQLSVVGKTDRYGRLVVVMKVDGKNLAELGTRAGYLRPWPHRAGKALSPKPDWCTLPRH